MHGIAIDINVKTVNMQNHNLTWILEVGHWINSKLIDYKKKGNV